MAKNNLMIEEIDEAAMLQSIYERDNPITPRAQTQPAAEVQLVPRPKRNSRKQKRPDKPKNRKNRHAGNGAM